MKTLQLLACGLALSALTAIGVAQDRPKEHPTPRKKVVRKAAKMVRRLQTKRTVIQRPSSVTIIVNGKPQVQRPARPRPNQNGNHTQNGKWRNPHGIRPIPPVRYVHTSYGYGRPGWTRPPVYTGYWSTRPGWNDNRWGQNTLITEWSGTRSGRGPFNFEGRGSENISDVSVQVQRDRDVTIRLRTRGRDVAFTGKARKEGDSLYVDIRGGGGLGSTEGVARIYLSKRYGEFYKVTGSGRMAGRRFSFTFDDWN